MTPSDESSSDPEFETASAAEPPRLLGILGPGLMVPTRPAIFDLRAILGTLDTVKGSKHGSLIVLNACPPPRGTCEAAVVTNARHVLAPFGVPVASVAIVNRSPFLRSEQADGVRGRARSKAAKEMRALLRVVEKAPSNGKAIPANRAGA